MTWSSVNGESQSSDGHLREFFLLLGIVTCLLLVVGGLHYYYKSRSLLAINSADESTSIELGKSSVENSLDTVAADLLFLAQNSHNLGLFDSSLPGLRQQLKLQFITLIGQHGEYDQIRYLDGSGREIVRVNYNDGRPYAVPKSLLQDKRTRYYFSKTWALDKGDIYISPMDLNIERGKIESPRKPVMRFGTPVVDSRGNKVGIVLINYLGHTLLDNFRRATTQVADHVELVNQQGYWLSHPDPNREWGFMYGRKDTLGAERPEAWETIGKAVKGQFYIKDDFYSFNTINLLSPTSGSKNLTVSSPIHQWKVVSRLSPDRLSAAGEFGSYLPFYGVAALVLGIASWLFARLRERHRQIQSVAEVAQRFRTTLENIDLLAVTVDLDGQVQFCNDAMVNLTGWEKQSIVGRSWFDHFVPADSVVQCKKQFKRILSEKNKSVHHECQMLCRGGLLVDISWNITLVLNVDDEIIGLTCVGENVTEAQRARRELQKLSRAVEQSPSTVMIVDIRGKIEYVNPRFYRLTGYTSEEVIGRNPSLLKSGHTDPEVYADLWNTIIAGKEWQGVLQNRKKNGELYWESTVISALRDQAGEATHYIAVKEDITERIRLETRFRQIFEATPNAMIMVDSRGLIVLVNSEAERCFGYQRAQLVGRSVEVLLPDTAQGHHPDLVRGYFTAPVTRRLGDGRKLQGKHRDGSILDLEIGLGPVETEEGIAVLCAFIDTRKQSRLEAELKQRNQEIAKAETLATVGRMANMVAHDLRNPLSSVKMSLQILGKKPTAEWGMEEHELRSIALDQVGYMERIMQDLLSYSRVMKLNPEWIKLDKLIDTVILLVQGQTTEKHIQIRTWHQPGLPTVHGDSHRLRQVFSNLILNAINATESNGSDVDISVSTHLLLDEHNQSIRIEIADHGPGIAEEIKDKIFEPFFTTRSRGTGLGLAIVRKIVEAHGGEMHFENLSKPGARAVVTLPTILPDDGVVKTGDGSSREPAIAAGQVAVVPRH
jgi:nitrogen fixation negative regulator NifL